jgi:AmmeMemoRadiSam system protein B
MGVTPLRTALRPSLVDGLFYPARKETLAAAVDELLRRESTPRAGRFGIISPHAGYEYAGPVMGAAFRAIADRAVRTAVVIGPVHRDAEQAIYLPDSSAFSTPLGPVPVDEEALSALAATDPLFQRNDIPHLEEHCLELQLPFLVRLFPGVAIVPLLVGASGRSGAEVLARSLSSVFAAREASTVFVVTANMASYMTGKDTSRESQELEGLLTRRDWKGMLGAAEARRISACGASCMAALLALAGDGCDVQVLARGRSEEPDEEPARVVHYAAVSVARRVS